MSRNANVAYRWAALKSPSLEEMEALADQAFSALPQAFRDLCAGILIRIDDFPGEDVLEAMKCETEFDLLGLFQGRGLAQREAVAHTGELPNMIWLYRRPILDYWAEHDESLGALVTHVMVHEIGHHFGLSDEDMEEIEREVADRA